MTDKKRDGSLMERRRNRHFFQCRREERTGSEREEWKESTGDQREGWEEREENGKKGKKGKRMCCEAGSVFVCARVTCTLQPTNKECTKRSQDEGRKKVRRKG